MEIQLGIDEAGRGALIGPLVIAGVITKKEIIQKMKVRDSKELSKKQREEKFSQLLDLKKEGKLDIIFEKIMPKEIDTFLNTIKLNKAEAMFMARIIRKLLKEKRENEIREVEIVIDCPSTNVKRWKEFLLKFLEKEKEANFIIKHNADKKFKIVGAASIIAKVIRDREIEKIKKSHKVEFGSGYPSDPLCREFLKTGKAKKLSKEGLIRKEWQTWKKISQKKLLDF